MQWLIDIIVDICKAYTDQAILDAKVIPPGTIIAWYGIKVDIPDGWLPCDGEDGAPNLKATFIRCASDTVDPFVTGGSHSHSHAGESIHTHPLVSGTGLATGKRWASDAQPPEGVGNTGSFSTNPYNISLPDIDTHPPPHIKGACNKCGKCCEYFDCPALDKVSRLCKVYPNRPTVCRQWPLTNDHIIMVKCKGYHT